MCFEQGALLRVRGMGCFSLRMFSSHGYRQSGYVKAVAQLAKFYMRPPAELIEEEVRNFFLELVEQRNVSPSTLKVYKCGIRFFYERTLNKAFHFMGTLRSKREAKLPTVLSVEEVRPFGERQVDYPRNLQHRNRHLFPVRPAGVTTSSW